MSDSFAMLVRCARHQPQPQVAFIGAKSPEDTHSHDCRSAGPEETPNLLVWTGTFHRLALSLKEA